MIQLTYPTRDRKAGNHMAMIMNINEYRNRRTEKARAELNKIIATIGTWDSKEEELRHYMDLAEKDERERHG